LPNVERVGSYLCIAQGETIADALSVPSDQGFPPRCYTPKVPLDPVFNATTAMFRCSVQQFYIRVIDLMYAGETGEALTLCRQFFGPIPSIRFHSGTTTLPGFITVVAPDYSVAIVHGTTNYQQLALQAFYTVSGPTNYGAYGTNGQWYAGSQWVHDGLVADGTQPHQAIFLAGHSYGGASVLNLAARYRFADPERLIRGITYGAPKPGDSRMTRLLADCAILNLQNQADFVCVLPPDIDLLSPVMTLIGNFGLIPWNLWKPPPNTLLCNPDGSTVPNGIVTLDTATLTGFVNQVLAHQTLFGIPAHTTPEYIRRIALRCPNEGWPAKGNLGLQGANLARGQIVWKNFAVANGRVGLKIAGVAQGRLGIRAIRLPAFGLSGNPIALNTARLGLWSQEAAKGKLGMFAYKAELSAIGYAGKLPIIGHLGFAETIKLHAGVGLAQIVGMSARLGLWSRDAARGHVGLFGYDAKLVCVGLSSFPLGRGALALETRALPSAHIVLGPTFFPSRGFGLWGQEAATGDVGLFGFDVAIGSVGIGPTAHPAGMVGFHSPIAVHAGVGLGLIPHAVGALGLQGFQVAAGRLGLNAGPPPPGPGATPLNKGSSAGASVTTLTVLVSPANSGTAVVTVLLQGSTLPAAPTVTYNGISMGSAQLDITNLNSTVWTRLSQFKASATPGSNLPVVVTPAGSAVIFCSVALMTGVAGTQDVHNNNVAVSSPLSTGLTSGSSAAPEVAMAAFAIVWPTSATPAIGAYAGFPSAFTSLGQDIIDTIPGVTKTAITTGYLVHSSGFPQSYRCDLTVTPSAFNGGSALVVVYK
jgi:hypothetical protein